MEITSTTTTTLPSALDIISDYSGQTVAEEETTTETSSSSSSSTDTYTSEAEELRAMADALLESHASSQLTNFSSLLSNMLGTKAVTTNNVDFSGLLSSVYSANSSYTAADFGIEE